MPKVRNVILVEHDLSKILCTCQTPTEGSATVYLRFVVVIGQERNSTLSSLAHVRCLVRLNTLISRMLLIHRYAI